MGKLVFLVLFVYSVGISRYCETTSTPNRGYVFMAPKRLLAGETESGCLSLHNLELPAHVLLELVPTIENQVLARTSAVVKTGTETCLHLTVPQTVSRSASLRLKIKFDKYPDYVVVSESTVEIEDDSLITFVETDKPTYKPGQDVKIRILMLMRDLKPSQKSIPEVWIENPSLVRVAQWTNVSTENGMAQLTFPLSPEPTLGTWNIQVMKEREYSNLIHTTQFEVEKYVLPKFQITINSPKYILADVENVTWNICVKYSYGKPVKGNLLLKLTPQTPSWRRLPNLPAIRYETELDKPDGCTEFVLSGTVLGLAHWKMDPNNIVLIAEFTEAGTGVVETTISRTVVMHEALKLEYENYTPKYFKFGLPYHGKLRVLRHDDTPAPNEKIQICLKVRGKIEWEKDVVECRDFMSSPDGFVDFVVPPQHKNIVLLSFVATAVDYPTTYYPPDQRWKVFMNQPSASTTVNPWYSPSDSYLTVARGNQPITCGEKYSFNVMYTTPPNMSESISFHYSINSKGGILIYGHVKHKPNRDTVLNYFEFHNLLGSIESFANKTEQTAIVHRFPLSVKVTPSMAPVSELLLYYVRSDGEIVATTYTIEVGHCFENKVKTAWHTDVQTPGSATQYHVEAAPGSLCGISAVDKSTLFLGKSKSNLISATQTFDQLRRFHPTPEPHFLSAIHCKSMASEGTNEEINHFPGFTELRKRRNTKYNVIYNKRVNYVDAVQAFVDFGVIVMSDLVLQTRPCPWMYMEHTDMFLASHVSSFKSFHSDAVAAAAMDPGVEYVDQNPAQTATLRSYFPETWLWELVPTGKEGKVTIERTLPHTITDWVGYTTCISPVHGLGIAPPTTITAFQLFFLDYSLPYSIKRGEIMRFKVSLFNYMHHSLPVKIKMEEVEGIDLHSSNSIASFCVKPRDSIVYQYILKPRVIGEVNVTVAAFIDTDFPEPCGPETVVFTRDVIMKPILILPEGFPMEETKSTLICPMDFSDDSAFMWELTLPEDAVPDSGRAYLNLIGDILGPALENLDKLVQLPKGCGEQNMVLFVPNIHVIKYLDVIGIDNPELRAKAIRNMEKGYQRELTYRHVDGSYSAFGSSESSIWLTAFVLKSFAQAATLIHIDEQDLKLSVSWITSQQLENGCFPVIGTVFHKQMKGGLEEYDGSSSGITAYILISLLESGVPLSSSVVNNAQSCLEKGTASGHNNLHTTVLTTYALALLGDPKANSSMTSLMNLATRYKNLVWWEDKTKPSIGLSIEMTAYVILTLLKLGDGHLIEALKAVRWISKQRNAEGGFTSTQDTVVGLEALTKYAMTVQHRNIDLSVLVTAKEVDYVYKLHNENRMVLKQIRLSVLPTIVEIFAQGKGCVLVQSNLKYNVPHSTGSDAFDLSVRARSVSHGNECSLQEITICARYKLADEESNMALLEIGMISGYVPDRASLHLLLDPSSKVKRFEEDQDTMTIYFDKLTGQNTCVSFRIIQEYFVDHLKPANVRLYDYYQQELTVSTNYTIASICSSAEPVDEQTTPNQLSTMKQYKEFNTSPVNSSFFVVNHELAVPDGIEGPIPVYMKPDAYDKTEMAITTNGSPDLTPTFATEDQTVSTIQIENEEPVQVEPDIEIKNTTSITETNIPLPMGVNQSCPVCMELPSNISDVYCSASSAVKVAIRRLRKVRLLLDLHPSREVQRLRATVEFTLSPNCSCLQLDNPGSFALIINKDNDFLASGDQKQTLNDSFHIYGLPMVSGMPCKLAEARAFCFNEENIQCTYEDPSVYG
ncbi:alpha-1-macroglobulin-like [Bombus affinis]|uniref:alpha-1-macroglobulin-like n=1 Tax=Bombus affinis TaxID=309941 RepID=UPI0021B7E905|nr:alpha-1-macroglobulin-like [Bombus affinis]